jgi:hypothetical protein
MSEQMRENFELHMYRQNICTRLARHPSDDTYKTISVQRAWELWQAALATQPQAPQGGGWQPIETAPKDGTSVLIANDAPGSVHPREGYYVKPAQRFSDEPIHLGWWRLAGSCAERIHGRTPTHWQPLPPAPTETPEAGK